MLRPILKDVKIMSCLESTMSSLCEQRIEEMVSQEMLGDERRYKITSMEESDPLSPLTLPGLPGRAR